MSNKILILLVLNAVAFTAFTQKVNYLTGDLIFDAKIIDRSEIPSGIKFEGNPKFVLKWTDKEGENYFIGAISDMEYTTPTHLDDSTQKWEKYQQTTYLFRISYTNKPWKVWSDNRSVACKSGTVLSFIKNSVTITDIDNDGIAEITFATRERCKNDTVPTYTNIVLGLVESDEQYIIRGLGLELPTKNKELTVSNICCIEDLLKSSPYLDSALSQKAQGMILNEKDYLNGKASEEFKSHIRKAWINAVKNEYDEYYNHPSSKK